MYYIWTDESDAHGKYFSNFYGGILIRSDDYEHVIQTLRNTVAEVGLCKEEIKWQKVNAYTFERYKRIIDVLFDLLEENKVRLRVFFRSTRFVALGLDKEQRRKEYQLLYYQFIKHAFGIKYANVSREGFRIRLFLDDMPLKREDRKEFIEALFKLNDTNDFRKTNARIVDVSEVDSKKHLPLQIMDLVLGAMCFRLNDKHKVRNIDGKLARRTVIKEALYKYIRSKICVIKPNFNIGISTGIVKVSDPWEQPYRHWNFVPNKHIIDEEAPKKHDNKKDSPSYPT